MLKTYTCHKTVTAGEITNISQNKLDINNCGYIQVTDAWMVKHQPIVGGYFIRYKDGYESFSPKEAFEEGYHEEDS